MLREKPAHFTLPFLRRERDRVSQPPAPGKSSPRWAGPLSVIRSLVLMRRVRNMQFSDDCRSHALVLIEIANESPKFKEQALALEESWLTLANIHNRFCSNPSFSGPLGGNDAKH